MFGLFESTPVHDEVLGPLARSRGHWRGTLTLADQSTVPLAVVGDRRAPAPAAVALARRAADDFAAVRTALTAELVAHAADNDDVPHAATGPATVWSQVRCTHVAVAPVSGVIVTEFGLQVTWDDEHTLGARVTNGVLTELNGSVLPP